MTAKLACICRPWHRRCQTLEPQRNVGQRLAGGIQQFSGMVVPINQHDLGRPTLWTARSRQADAAEATLLVTGDEHQPPISFARSGRIGDRESPGCVGGRCLDYFSFVGKVASGYPNLCPTNGVAFGVKHGSGNGSRHEVRRRRLGRKEPRSADGKAAQEKTAATSGEPGGSHETPLSRHFPFAVNLEPIPARFSRHFNIAFPRD